MKEDLKEFLRKELGVPEILLPVALSLCEREADKNVLDFVQETPSSGLLIFSSPKDGLEIKEFHFYHITAKKARFVDSAPISTLAFYFSNFFPLQGIRSEKKKEKTTPPTPREGYNKGGKGKKPQGGQT